MYKTGPEFIIKGERKGVRVYKRDNIGNNPGEENFSNLPIPCRPFQMRV